MSDLQIRHIPFDFEGVDFIWNPEQPGFSAFMNMISMMAIGLEKYFCRAMADAEAVIRDEAVRQEARLFRMQEAIHSQAHKLHIGALIKRYPGLKETLDASIASYDALYEHHPLRFHLGYAGGLEAIFTPLFRMLIEHRQTLFSGGDARVASLMLWHFCEEIEHRSSALTVFNEVVGSPLYRLRGTGAWRRHGAEIAKLIYGGFKAHVPDAPHAIYKQDPLKDVPRGAKILSSLGILESQAPWHRPQKARLPAYYAQWRERYERGEDMRLAYGRIPGNVVF
jgi:predicted metal-dependent hydrolase